MRIVYHLGANYTDEELLLKCLLKNRHTLSRRGVIVPSPKRYRNLLRDTAIELKGKAASRDTQALILDQIMEEDIADRLVLSWDSFLSLAPWALKDKTLYPSAGDRVRAFSQIFPEIEAEFFLAIRNPATFLPGLLAMLPSKTYDEFIGDANIFDLHWSDVVERILRDNPGVPLTIWCDAVSYTHLDVYKRQKKSHAERHQTQPQRRRRLPPLQPDRRHRARRARLPVKPRVAAAQPFDRQQEEHHHQNDHSNLGRPTGVSAVQPG